MSNQQMFIQIAMKKLGLLILKGRTAAHKTTEECAQAVGTSPEQFQAFEKGQGSPSMPQLELLALYLNTPVETFFGKETPPVVTPSVTLTDLERKLMLRNRIIGASLRMARTNAGLTLSQMSEKSTIAEEILAKYEIGALPVPVPELDVIAGTLNLPVENFLDHNGPIGKWRAQQEAMQSFLNLPAELQQFVTKPVNLPYLELAVRLSDMNVEKLRAVAENLLEITY